MTDKDCETAARVPHPPFGYCKDSEAVGSVWKADPATASRVAMCFELLAGGGRLSGATGELNALDLPLE